MIPIFNDAGDRMPLVFNTDLRLNEPIDGNPMHLYEINAVMVRDVFSGTVESHPVNDGSEAYGTRKSAKIIRVDGIIRAPTLAQLSDMNAELRGEMDPATLSKEDALGHGFAPLEFTVLSVAGNQASYVWARPVQTPDYMWDQYIGHNAPFRLEFFCADPRRYLQTANNYVYVGSDVLTPTQNGNYSSIPDIVIVRDSGSASTTYTITNSDVTPDGIVKLNLSSTVDGDIIRVYIDDKVVTKNGARADGLVHDDTNWDMYIRPGLNNIAVTNGGNTTTTITVYHAYSM